MAMDVRNIEDVAPVVEHNGTVPVWWMVKSQEMKEATDGGFLELVNEFEVEGGGHVFPHSHPTHEFYYVLRGRGIMTIEGEDRDHRPGRPGPHPARRGAQPPAGQRQRVDPLLLLRHRRQGRRDPSTTPTTERPDRPGRFLDRLESATVQAVGPPSMSEASRPSSSTVVAPRRRAAK